MSNTAIKIEHLKKRYRLGQIGGTTLTAELQSWWAKKRHREDPNVKIGMDISRIGEQFLALDDINLEINKGEALGIIGANGAGKSTLLKILSRVTAPSSGDVWINGRISSMLEVGTGFHQELTGRENIYMNGAILGMSRKEIDAKIESIIDFSECRQFIDTPVKRYSSGMYVKLAFAVASHLDAEIMIMDEVLAVGDMAFQKKSLGKMGEAATDEGRTVLYVSHNMATIRRLCTKCIVLDHGKLIYTGGVEDAISLYMNHAKHDGGTVFDFSDAKTHSMKPTGECYIQSISLLGKEVSRFLNTESCRFRITWEAFEPLRDFRFGLSLKNADESAVGYAESDYSQPVEKGMHTTDLEFDLSLLGDGSYIAYFEIFYLDGGNGIHAMDQTGAVYFDVINAAEDEVRWERQYWGSVRLKRMRIADNT